MEKIYKEACTHAGVFHADDVFSAAFVQLIWPDIKIRRVNRVPEGLEEGLVFDIGLGEFDHHQTDNECRENGVPYAAFGKLWRAFATELGLSVESVDFLDCTLVQKIDAQDNGLERNTLSCAVSDFVPSWNEEKPMEKAFFEAVAWAKAYLQRAVKREKAKSEAFWYVEEAKNAGNGKVLVLDRFAPWQENAKYTELMYAVYPSQRGGWCVQTVGVDVICESGFKEPKKRFPEEWGGKSPEELKALTGYNITFCHKAGFLLSVESKEEAVALANELAEKEGDEG